MLSMLTRPIILLTVDHTKKQKLKTSFQKEKKKDFVTANCQLQS